jgi:plastocyanin
VGQPVTWQFRGFHTATFPGTMKPYPFITPLSQLQPATMDAAGAPFWWGAKAPVIALSPLSVAPQGGSTISSAAALRSSGLERILAAPQNAPPQPYMLTFTKPGTYRYQCAVHPTMRGSVRVVPRNAAVPSARMQAATAAKELKAVIASAKSLDKTQSPALQVSVGAGDKKTGAEVASFYPRSLSIKVGDTVTFANGDPVDIHTVTFGPSALRNDIETNFATPTGNNVFLNPLGALSSDPPGVALRYDGSNHGNGYLNSGILQPRGSPQAAGPQSIQVTFTKPGTYDYECVVHMNMDGTIVVQ